jgi:hypothetical protein
MVFDMRLERGGLFGEDVDLPPLVDPLGAARIYRVAGVLVSGRTSQSASSNFFSK